MIAPRKPAEENMPTRSFRTRASRILQGREVVSLTELSEALGLVAEDTHRLMRSWEGERRVKTLLPVYAGDREEFRPSHIYYRWVRQDDAEVSWQLRVRLKQVAQPPRLGTLAFRFSPAY